MEAEIFLEIKGHKGLVREVRVDDLVVCLFKGKENPFQVICKLLVNAKLE